MLPNDRVQAIPADIGEKVKSITVIDKVIDVDVAPIITSVSTDSNIVFKVLWFLYLSYYLRFLSLRYVMVSLRLLMWLLKLLTLFIFFL